MGPNDNAEQSRQAKCKSGLSEEQSQGLRLVMVVVEWEGARPTVLGRAQGGDCWWRRCR